MEALVSNVYPTSDLVTQDPNDSNDDLVAFNRKPTDSRFLSNPSVTLTPEEPLSPEITVLTYNLPRTSLPTYTAVNEILVSLCVSIEKKGTSDTAWKPLVTADNVAPVNFLPDMLWEKVEIYLGDTLISPSHSYRYVGAHVGRMMAYNKEAFNTYCATELGYHEETSPDITTEGNIVHLAKSSKYKTTLKYTRVKFLNSNFFKM